MLKRLYIHNYKCLVNFEINFDQDVSLFLGANGSGKSTVFEVLTKLRMVIVDEEKIINVFNYFDNPRWLNNDTKDKNIHFELDVEVKDFIYRYVLVICFSKSSIEPKIREESLYKNNKRIIESNDKGTFLEEDEDPIKFNSVRSVINRFTTFIDENFLLYLRDFFIARINPYVINSTIDKASSEIFRSFSNFPEWFSYLNEQNRRGISTFENAMRDVLSGFDYFRIEKAGQAKLLVFEFENKTNKGDPIKYWFDELSEGQKVLIALYTLIYCTPDNSIICIDEPENFLALPEIQPWLNAMRDQCSERNLQVILISHHPSLINFLTANSGYWFSREDNHTRIQRITKQNEGGLSFAQLIELGWIYEG